MRSKPFRKNAHKERIFSLVQNRVDFDYLKGHREEPLSGKARLATQRRGFLLP